MLLLNRYFLVPILSVTLPQRRKNWPSSTRKRLQGGMEWEGQTRDPMSCLRFAGSELALLYIHDSRYFHKLYTTITQYFIGPGSDSFALSLLQVTFPTAGSPKSFSINDHKIPSASIHKESSKIQVSSEKTRTPKMRGRRGAAESIERPQYDPGSEASQPLTFPYGR